MIVWEISHDAADRVIEKQAGSGPIGAKDSQTDMLNKHEFHCAMTDSTNFSDS